MSLVEGFNGPIATWHSELMERSLNVADKSPSFAGSLFVAEEVTLANTLVAFAFTVACTYVVVVPFMKALKEKQRKEAEQLKMIQGQQQQQKTSNKKQAGSTVGMSMGRKK